MRQAAADVNLSARSLASYSTHSYCRPSRRRAGVAPVCSTRWHGIANANQEREQEPATARMALGAPMAAAIFE